MASYYAKTLGQVVDGALRLAGQFQGAGRDGLNFSRAEARAMANDVLLTLARETHILRTSRLIPLVATVNVYNLPSDLLILTRVGLAGAGGYVCAPTTSGTLDLLGQTLAVTGSLQAFYQDILSPKQIAVWPVPATDTGGSTTTRDATTGLLRQVKDADGNIIQADATTGGLRRVRGVPFRATGKGRIVRELLTAEGNLIVGYVRAPREWKLEKDHPDGDIPAYLHHDIRWEVAGLWLANHRSPLMRQKGKSFRAYWQARCGQLLRFSRTTGATVIAQPC